MNFITRTRAFLLISGMLFCHLLTLAVDEPIIKEKTATVLLLHMFHERYEEAPDLQLYTMVERINNAFKEKDIEATIIPITSNKWERDLKKRQASFIRQINTFIAHSRKLKITHIVLAGHGNSNKSSLVIGDIALNKYNVRDFYEDFELLRAFLAPKVKIFLFGCSTFKNSEEEEFLIKANWLRKIFETKEVELFGYEYEVSSGISASFWLGDLKSILIAYGSALFLGSFKLAVDKGKRFFTDGDWEACAAFLVGGTPVLATSHWFFSHYLKDTAFITWFRELFFYGNLGTVITFEGSKKKLSRRILGHDYFRKEFVTLT